jgi:hypothetical protein
VNFLDSSRTEADSCTDIISSHSVVITWPIAQRDRPSTLTLVEPVRAIPSDGRRSQNLLKEVNDIAEHAGELQRKGSLSLRYLPSHPRGREEYYKVPLKPINRTGDGRPTDMEVIEDLLKTITTELGNCLNDVPLQSLTKVRSTLDDIVRQRLHQTWIFQSGKAYKGLKMAEMRRHETEQKRDRPLVQQRQRHKTLMRSYFVRLLRATAEWVEQFQHYGIDEGKTQDFEAVGRAVVETSGILRRGFEELLPWK